MTEKVKPVASQTMFPAQCRLTNTADSCFLSRMIPKETLFNNGQTPGMRPVLVNEIGGVRTVAMGLSPGATDTLAAAPGSGQALLFTQGRGSVRTADKVWPIREPTLFVPRPDQTVTVEAAGERPLTGLALTMTLTDAERRWLAAAPERFPFFVAYSECKTYKEKIKSPKTVSRTLLPAHTYPRLCIGSVETDGPDHVAAHAHPMLEQYFLGLSDNQCRVHADADTVDFGPNDLLHIPLGSNHSVDVDAGRHLHYVWIDIFHDERGMAWIDEEHEDEP